MIHSQTPCNWSLDRISYTRGYVGKVDKRRRPREIPPRAGQFSVPARQSHTSRWHFYRLLALWAIVLLAYSNSFRAGLVFDAASIVGQDPRIRLATLENLASILTGRYWYVSTTAHLYRPLTTISYLFNYAVLGNGINPLGYHVINFALHAVNVALIYALGMLIFEEAMPAWALAAIWGLHPLLAESVTNVVGRADLLAAFGVLAGLLCHVQAASGSGRRRSAWLAALALCQAIGLFSKENAAVLPAIMLLYDLACPGRTTWRRRVSAYAAVAVPFIVYLGLRSGLQGSMRIDFAENPLVSAGFWTARLTAIKVIGKYLGLFLWPAGLSADYSYNAVPVFGAEAPGGENALALFSLAVCLGAAALAVQMAVRKRPAARPALFFLVFFIVALAPTSNVMILIGSIMAERFMYLPAVGLAGCLVASVSLVGARLFPKTQAADKLAWAALGAVLAALGVRTYARNFDWRDERSLWSSAVRVYPQSARPHYNLGNALAADPALLPEAIAEYRAALRIRPDDADAHTNLGTALSRIPGRLPEAIAEYQAALRIRPDDVDALDNLGNALSGIPGRMSEAIAAYQAALRIRPDRADVHYNLASVLVRSSGSLPQAIAEFRTALRIQPDNAEAHNNLGTALANMGQMAEAIEEFRAAARVRPDQADAHFNLANALAGIPGSLPEAIAEYQAVLRIQPDRADAHNNLGAALAEIPGRLPEAIAEYQAAIRIVPDFAGAHVNLENALAELKSQHRQAARH